MNGGSQFDLKTIPLPIKLVEFGCEFDWGALQCLDEYRAAQEVAEYKAWSEKVEQLILGDKT
jgi:hypothetical protein